MQQTAYDKRTRNTSIWVLALVCTAALVFALCAGAAHTAVRAARLTAAKASIGQLEAVLYLAEKTAEDNGYGAAPDVYGNMLKSYDDAAQVNLTDQERYVLKTMLDSFGPARDFDFAITRYQEGSAVKMQIYFFPVRGRTNVKTDRYYLMENGQVLEKNS